MRLILALLFPFIINAQCTGDKYCSACTNCRRCHYCKSGGVCGVCSPESFKEKPSPKIKPSPKTYIIQEGTYSDSSFRYFKNGSESPDIVKKIGRLGVVIGKEQFYLFMNNDFRVFTIDKESVTNYADSEKNKVTEFYNDKDNISEKWRWKVQVTYGKNISVVLNKVSYGDVYFLDFSKGNYNKLHLSKNIDSLLLIQNKK